MYTIWASLAILIFDDYGLKLRRDRLSITWADHQLSLSSRVVVHAIQAMWMPEYYLSYMYVKGYYWFLADGFLTGTGGLEQGISADEIVV